MVEVRGAFQHGKPVRDDQKYDPACGAMLDAADCLDEMKVATPSGASGKTRDDKPQMNKNFETRLMS